MPIIHHEEPIPSGECSPSKEPAPYEESTPCEEHTPRESPNHSEKPKLYRLYVALYNLGVTFVNDLFKDTTTVLCDVMDLRDDNGVEQLQEIAESAPIYDDGDKSFCRTWVENVLQKAGEEGYTLRAPIEQIRETVLQLVSDSSNKNPLKILEPFDKLSL
ncbi:hypothetical protein F4680DRAFT_444878 [Xylaria scruposa]|nr:hypothetical protein F4680DRAFT_444878 [Xylaria scruposa]